eukprot:813072_1
MIHLLLHLSALFCLTYSQNKGSGVYGIAGPNYHDGGAALVKYDINTGATTTIVAQRNAANPKVSGQNLGCLDTVRNVYYFMSSIVNTSSPTGQTTVLYGYNLTNPSISNMIEIKLYQIKAAGIIGAGDACIGNPDTGDIYIFGHDAVNKTNQLLLKMSNPNTIETIGNYASVDKTPLLAGDPTILDTKRNMLWVAGTQTGQEMYFYINLANGELVQNVNFHQYPLIAGSIYNEKYDSIVGVEIDKIHSNSSVFVFELEYCNPETLNVSKVFSGDMIGYCGQMKAVTQDVKSNILYSLFLNNNDCDNNYTDDVYLVGTNIDTGKQLSSVRVAQIDDVYNTAPYDVQYWNAP